MSRAENPNPEGQPRLTPQEQFRRTVDEFQTNKSIPQERKDQVMSKIEPRLRLSSGQILTKDGKFSLFVDTPSGISNEQVESLNRLGVNANAENDIHTGHVAPDQIINLAKLDVVHYIAGDVQLNPINSPQQIFPGK